MPKYTVTLDEDGCVIAPAPDPRMIGARLCKVKMEKHYSTQQPPNTRLAGLEPDIDEDTADVVGKAPVAGEKARAASPESPTEPDDDSAFMVGKAPVTGGEVPITRFERPTGPATLTCIWTLTETEWECV
jgi:hypothetical protein